MIAEPDNREHGHSRPSLIEANDRSDHNQLHLVANRQIDAEAGTELSFDTKNDIADCFLRLAALPTFALDRLSRYEHLLWRQAPPSSSGGGPNSAKRVGTAEAEGTGFLVMNASLD